MRILILTIAIFILGTSAFAQSFTISELIKINNYTIDDFDTYVTQKGFVFYKNNSEDFGEFTSYVFYVNDVKKSYVSKFFYKNKSKEMVSFQTGNPTTYLNIKSELKTLGFKFIDTETNKGTTFFNYKNGKIEISLASSVQENNIGDKLTTYEISVARFY